MLDLKKIRRLYFDPPPPDPDRLPSREELYAREERRAVERCLLSGGDPRTAGLGEHGSLIGGPRKPLRRFTWDPEFAPRSRDPLPLSWFDNPRARSRAGDLDPARVRLFFAHLSGGLLAGMPARPSGLELHHAFRSASLSPRRRDQVWHVLASMRLDELPRLLSRGGLSVYEIARAIHLSGTHRPRVVAWMNQFGRKPGSNGD